MMRLSILAYGRLFVLMCLIASSDVSAAAEKQRAMTGKQAGTEIRASIPLNPLYFGIQGIHPSLADCSIDFFRGNGTEISWENSADGTWSSVKTKFSDSARVIRAKTRYGHSYSYRDGSETVQILTGLFPDIYIFGDRSKEYLPLLIDQHQPRYWGIGIRKGKIKTGCFVFKGNN